MGYVENPNGPVEEQILHDWMFVGPAEGQDFELEGEALDWWLLNMRAPLRVACTCGWVSPDAGPEMPEIALSYPKSDDKPKTAVGWGATGSFIAVLPWYHVGEVDWPADVVAWKNYQLLTWKAHIFQTFPGTWADDPAAKAPAAIMALLADVDDGQHGGEVVLRRLQMAQTAFNETRRLAVAAARRQGRDWQEISNLTEGLGPEAARLMYENAADNEQSAARSS